MIRTTKRLQIEYDHYKDVFNVGADRKRENVLLRHAFMVASREMYTCQAIGEVMGKDHATVVHAVKNHEMNYRFIEQYRQGYNFATKQIQKLAEMMDEVYPDTKTMYITENIRLRQRVQELQEKLNAQNNEFCDRPSTANGVSSRDKLLELQDGWWLRKPYLPQFTDLPSSFRTGSNMAEWWGGLT